MSDSLEDILSRLAAVQMELDGLEGGPSPRRFELLIEQDGLRRQAARYAPDWDRGRSTEELKAELKSLRNQRKHLVSGRVGYATSKGGSNQGPSSGAWVKLGQESLAGAGLGRLNRRISEIQDELASRETGP